MAERAVLFVLAAAGAIASDPDRGLLPARFMMLSEDEAKISAREVARGRYTPPREGDVIVVDDSRTKRSRIGWVFWPESQHALETDNYDSALTRVAPIFVHRFEGWAASIEGSAPTDFEVSRRPDPDWPDIAWLTMPRWIWAGPTPSANETCWTGATPQRTFSSGMK